MFPSGIVFFAFLFPLRTVWKCLRLPLILLHSVLLLLLLLILSSPPAPVHIHLGLRQNRSSACKWCLEVLGIAITVVVCAVVMVAVAVEVGSSSVLWECSMTMRACWRCFPWFVNDALL